MTNGAPIGTKEGVVYVVTASDPNRKVTFEDGTVLKGTVTLDNVKGMKITDKGYLFGDCAAWVKHIVPIPLTPKILEDNGWLFLNDGYIKCYQHPKDWRLQVQIIKGKYLAYLHDELLHEINQVHQLQHLLFGLGLNSELKV